MTTPTSPVGTRALLALAAVAVGFAAVDTYVVVLALPDMMVAVDIDVEQLQRAAPIVSGFLLGYVAVLPLVGRVADLRGPVPVLLASLVVLAVGSAVTAASYDLVTMVLGRFVQGVGGGGLVPATMTLVAALYPVERRGLPLGLVSAVQELGSVLGPLAGAAVLAFGSWRSIFGLTCAGGLLLWAAVRVQARSEVPPREGRPDLLGAALVVVAVGATYLLLAPPRSLYTDLTWGELFIPLVDDGSRWTQPVGLVAVAAAAAFALRCLLARRPLVDVRSWGRTLVEADLAGAAWLAVALGGVVLAFASADPEQSAISPQAPWFLLGSAVAVVGLVRHLRRAASPLVPRGTLAPRPAWGALVVSLLVGWALIAALVDIPLFARTAERDYDQLDAALVLVRFLLALPVGAVVGGLLVRRLPAGAVTAGGMLAASGAFWWMAQWDQGSLDSTLSTLPLVLGGLGFGLALAPVNAAMLASTRDDAHGLASALVVVARMIGMLVGISVLTTYGLARLYDERRADPSLGLRELGLLQERAVFEGAALVALVAAVAAVALFRGAATRGVDTREALRVG
ncbi:MFS transporter [Nocardioides litoris]|uniref:MFS transporter n=1 Tax=Nocardioides litoris TaxID=1926648 RepID=UPI0011209BD9|nr:MFS transporter [Nocardioides litoris]